MQMGMMMVTMGMFLMVMMNMRVGNGIRFVIDKEECFSHNIVYEGDIVHASFVVIKADASWHHIDDGIDLIVRNSPLSLSLDLSLQHYHCSMTMVVVVVR